VLLRQEVSDGVHVLCVHGPVTDENAVELVEAVRGAFAQQSRSVVLDLRQVSVLTEGARTALGRLPELPVGSPRATLTVRPPAGSPDISGWLRPSDGGPPHVQVDRRARPRTRIDVEHSPQGPAQARAAVHERAQEMGLGAVHDDVLLVVSEMVTNAVRYAAPPVRLEIQAGDRDVVVAVCDGSTDLPAPRQADMQSEGGRGMLLVDLLTAEHGVRTDPPGKAVWARLRKGDNS
jgi:anti-sigma regulatory factor (Ser/Thr protein kinase)